MIDYLVEEFGCDRKELSDLLNRGKTFFVRRNDDTAIFTEVSKGILEGHYAFKSKGRKALKIAEGILEDVFNNGYDVVLGRTPLDNKKARWFSRQLGFKSISIEDTYRGPVEVFMKRKNEE